MASFFGSRSGVSAARFAVLPGTVEKVQQLRAGDLAREWSAASAAAEPNTGAILAGNARRNLVVASPITRMPCISVL
jgi:hypothetical protein